MRKVEGARVDLWHADGQGMYSGYSGQGDDGSTRGETFLRGTQFTGADGQVRCHDLSRLVPGCTPHSLQGVSRCEEPRRWPALFSNDLSARIYAGARPNDRKPKREIVAQRGLHIRDLGGAATLVSVTEEGGSYLASHVIAVDRAG
jgi:hypothetical protein